MKKILFIADFFKEELPGGGESNDHNLIKFLAKKHNVTLCKSDKFSVSKVDKADIVIVANFVAMAKSAKDYLIRNKKYIIYEHDHKYVNTRDPSKFNNFSIPVEHLINENFYKKAHCVVVLSKVCKEILQLNIPEAKVHNIGCSLWSKKTFRKLKRLSANKKTKDLCIMKNSNPTKNYINTIKYCEEKKINYEEIASNNYHEFLEKISKYEKLLFLPTVLETFSRLCAEAKMLDTKVMTNKKLIGFFSEEYSKLSGLQLISKIEEKNQKALQFFEDLIC